MSPFTRTCRWMWLSSPLQLLDPSLGMTNASVPSRRPKVVLMAVPVWADSGVQEAVRSGGPSVTAALVSAASAPLSSEETAESWPAPASPAGASGCDVEPQLAVGSRTPRTKSEAPARLDARAQAGCFGNILRREAGDYFLRGGGPPRGGAPVAVAVGL